MSIKLSDLSESEKALVLQQAREEIAEKPSEKIYSDQTSYLDEVQREFIKNVTDFNPSANYVAVMTSDKVKPFVQYLMKMLLVYKYHLPVNCQARAKTEAQLEDFKKIVDQVFGIMYQVNGIDSE